MSKYRMLPVILAVGMLFPVGCSADNEVVNYETQEEASYNISFFGNKYEAENVEVIEDILTGFMEENRDVSITYESLKGNEYFDALANRCSAGKLDDIFITNHDTALEFAQKGSLANLSDIVEATSFSDSIVSQMKASDGNFYWVPTTVSAFGMYCNMDLLKAHGKEIPKNLGEWEAVCDYFVSEGITPIIANNDISLKTFILAEGFYPLYQEGHQNEVFEKINSGEEKLSAYLGEGIRLAKQFCDKGYIDAAKASKTKKTSDDLEEFAKGQSPFMLTGVWAAGRVESMKSDFAFQVVPYPILEDGSVLVINPDVRLSISAQGDNQGMAKEFVSYFLRKDNIRRFADNQCSFSPLEDEYTPSREEILGIVESYGTEISVIASDSNIEFPIWDILTNVSEKLLSGEDEEEVSEWMDQQAVS